MLAALLSVLFSWDEGEWKVRGHPYVDCVYITGANHEDMGPRGTDAYLAVLVNPKVRGENEAAADWALDMEESFYFKYDSPNDRSHAQASRKAAKLAARWAAFYQRQAAQWKARGKKVTPPWR